MNKTFQDFLDELVACENFRNSLLNLSNNYNASFLKIDIDLYDFEYLEIKKIIEYSSLLALSNNFFHLELSQKINSYLLYLYSDDKNIIYGIQMIYVRVGNFPIIKQDIFKNFSLKEDGDYIFDNDLNNEYILEKNESKLFIGGKESYLNKFQKEILESINTNDVLSISAPTSFGKSFVVRTYLTQSFSESINNSALIIVPSKALIDDFLNDLISIKKDYKLSYNVITHFVSDDNVDNKIFILTQERLLATLRKNPEILRGITLFYCDEAHKVAYTGRGFILRRVIEDFLKYNESAKKIFTSPIIKNPDYFINKFFSQKSGISFDSKLVEYKPVEKNIFLYSLDVNSKSYDIFEYNNLTGKYKKELLIENISLNDISFSDIELYKEDNNLYKLDVVLKSNFEGNTVIYVTSKSKLILYAKHLLNNITEIIKKPSDKELENIKEYIEENFYNGLYILNFLEKGIGIHAGFLPVGLRNYVIELFKNGKISYILCTSTLLEGVNLPIKNIILLNTNSGNGNSKMSKTDFFNLIGRAGRFRYELSGNVILFTDKENKDIYNDYLNVQDSELEIRDVENNIINKTEKKNKLMKIFRDDDFDSIYKMKNDKEAYEYMFYSFFINTNELNKLNLKDKQKNIIEEKINFIKDDSFFSKNIFFKNIGISPISQKKLYDRLVEKDQKELEKFYTLLEDRFRIKPEFKTILDILQNIFYIKRLTKYDKDFDSEKEFAKLINWISGKSINEIIATDVSYYIRGYRYYKKKNPPENKVDDKALESLSYYTNVIGFEWVKYIRVFYNILFDIFLEKGIDVNKDDYEKRIESFLFTLETGISSQIGKYLYSKGISRAIANKVNKLIYLISKKFVKDINEFDDNDAKIIFNKKRVKVILSFRLSKIAYDELYNNLDV